MEHTKVAKEFFKYNNEVYNEKIYRINTWMKGGTAPPYKLIIVPTNRCNLNCFCCPNAFARSQGRFRIEDELTDEQWISIVKEGLRLGVKEWYILGGGEPFMRKELVKELVRLIKQNDFYNICEIITNGTLWDESDVQEIVKLKLDRLLISIDSCDFDHDYVRRTEGAFIRAKKTLELFQKYKKLLVSDKPILQMNSVISNRNFLKIKEIVKFAIDNGVDELAFHPMREYEETKELMSHLKLSSIDQKKMHEQINEAKKLVGTSHLVLDLSMVDESTELNKENNAQQNSKTNDSEENYSKARCFEPFYSIFIDPKGNANFCCAAGDSIDEQNIVKRGLECIWYDDFFNEIRKIILHNQKTPKCDNCGLLDMTKELRQDLRKYNNFILK